MEETHKKAQATRRENEAYRRQLWEEQCAAKQTIRQALLRVMEREDSTPAEILEAARLLVEIGK